MSNFALLFVLGVLGSVLAHQTTTSPLVLPHVYATDQGILGALQNRGLWKRQQQCDQNQFFCPTGTCFTDPANGYIGCCTAPSCAPRTQCIEYDPTLTTRPCDANTGGCLYCSRSDNPHCMKITNIGANQWIQYCATTSSVETLSYANLITTGSQWYASTASATAVTSSSLSTPLSTSTPLISQTSDLTTSLATSSSDIAQPASALATAQSTSNTTSSKGTEDPEPTSTLSRGAIGGIVAGAVVGLSAIGLAIWMLWKQKAKKKPAPLTFSTPEKHAKELPTPPSGTTEDPAEAEGSTPREPSQFFSPTGFSRYHEADSRPVSMNPVPLSGSGLGIRAVDRSVQQRSSKYTISNPDPVSPSSGQASPFISPMLSQQGESPPSTQFSPKTPMSDRRQQNLPYTPSLYAADPPESIPHTSNVRPPSLPQPYSTVTFPGDATTSVRPERRSGLYRGLSSRAGEPTPPWAYLSPESAVNGGWINGHDESH